MSRPLRIEYPGAFYHVTSRGNERRTLFQSNRDKEKFLSYLESTHERYGDVIHLTAEWRNANRKSVCRCCTSCKGRTLRAHLESQEPRY
ncbi:MAG: hypothetical protein FJ106_03490 [Deltaproteobacteria bacterium]|nr:hypothetical protein [Deltaproteobacteria bacterium]